jgi:hypothetical protein
MIDEAIGDRRPRKGKKTPPPQGDWFWDDGRDTDTTLTRLGRVDKVSDPQA